LTSKVERKGRSSSSETSKSQMDILELYGNTLETSVALRGGKQWDLMI
jgi:hypothetical protein